MKGFSPVSAPSGSSQPPAELGETVPEGGQHEAVQERVDGGGCLTEHGCKRTVRERHLLETLPGTMSRWWLRR